MRYVYQHGQTVRGQLLSLRYIENKRRSSYRLAVVVSKKVSKSAVVRNRIRRRIYEIVRLHQQAIARPYDMVITVFNEQCAGIEHDKLEKQIIGQMKESGVLS